MSWGASREALYRRAAICVDRILKGAKPGDLPVEQPKLELVINANSPKTLRPDDSAIIAAVRRSGDRVMISRRGFIAD